MLKLLCDNYLKCTIWNNLKTKENIVFNLQRENVFNQTWRRVNFTMDPSLPILSADLKSFSSLYHSLLTPSHFPTLFLTIPPPPLHPLLFFSLTCGKHYILSGGEGEQTSQAETGSLLGRRRGVLGRLFGSACW